MSAKNHTYHIHLTNLSAGELHALGEVVALFTDPEQESLRARFITGETPVAIDPDTGTIVEAATVQTVHAPEAAYA